MQDIIAIAVAVAAGVWLARTLWRQLRAPSCGTPANPAGADGFIPLDSLIKKKPGRSEERPGP
jgi:hypothetical protein